MEEHRCRLCGRPIAGNDTSRVTGSEFCSAGCEGIADSIGVPSKTRSGQITEQASREPSEESGTAETEVVRTHFRIDGMYSVTCEEYLEAIANRQAGVIEAEASYITESVRVVHDPDQSSREAIRDALSTLGYTAFERSNPDNAESIDSPVQIERERTGVRKRRSEQFLAFRYAAGLLFGAFLLLPYVAIIYPAHLAEFFDWTFLQGFTTAIQFDNQGMFAFLRLYFVLTGAILIFTGLPVLRGAYISLKMRRPTTDLLVAIAVLGSYAYSTLVVVLGGTNLFFDLTIVMAASVTTAAFYEAAVKKRGLQRLTDLTVSSVTTANRIDGAGAVEEISVTDVVAGDRLVVREGERVPVDGTIVDGTSSVDERVVTGESFPVEKHPGDSVIGGSIVRSNAITIEVNPGESSSFTRLTQQLWELQSVRHGIHRMADRLAGVVLPFVIGGVLVVSLIALWLGTGVWVAVTYGLLAIVVGTPWALGISTPLTVAYGIRAALDRNIVVFNESLFERVRSVDFLVFDKTGTLTSGEMSVIDKDLSADLYEAVGLLETRASHPVARAIRLDVFTDEQTDAIRASNGNESESSRVTNVTTYGAGVGGTVDGEDVLVGALSVFDDQGWDVPTSIRENVTGRENRGLLPVVVGKNGWAEGIVVLGDEPRDGWETALADIEAYGIDIVILTGDTTPAATPFSSAQNVTYLFTGVPPEGKRAAIEQLRTKGTVGMVGDGTNDALALATADLGISMGNGTALAADAADVTIADNDIASVKSIFRVAHTAHDRLQQNNALAGLYNIIAIGAAVTGVFNPLTGAISVATTIGVLVWNASRSYG